MAGDDLVKNPIHVTTRAVTIRADRNDVWPWLVQMGHGRGGLYSYDFVGRVMGSWIRKAPGRSGRSTSSWRPATSSPWGPGRAGR